MHIKIPPLGIRVVKNSYLLLLGKLYVVITSVWTFYKDKSSDDPSNCPESKAGIFPADASTALIAGVA